MLATTTSFEIARAVAEQQSLAPPLYTNWICGVPAAMAWTVSKPAVAWCHTS